MIPRPGELVPLCLRGKFASSPKASDVVRGETAPRLWEGRWKKRVPYLSQPHCRHLICAAGTILAHCSHPPPPIYMDHAAATWMMFPWLLLSKGDSLDLLQKNKILSSNLWTCSEQFLMKILIVKCCDREVDFYNAVISKSFYSHRCRGYYSQPETMSCCFKYSSPWACYIFTWFPIFIDYIYRHCEYDTPHQELTCV